MPIKILHLSDIHMGTENYGRIDPETGLHTRLQDFVESLRFVVDTALEEGVSLALFSGDAYRSCDPSPTHQRALASQLRRLSDAEIPIVMIVGNHDNPVAYGRASSIEIFGTLGPPGVQVVAKPEFMIVETVQGPIQLACLPWPMKNNLLTRDEYKALTETETQRRIEEICIDIIHSFADRAESEIPCILVAHIAAREARYSGAERAAVIGHDPTIMSSVLANPAFDYVALGHVHRFQDLNPSGRPHIVYPGSIERVDFGEEREDRGFCIVTCQSSKEGETTFKFVKTPARPFLTIDMDLNGLDDPMEALIERIGAADLSKSVVRVLYDIEEDRQHLVDIKAVRGALESAFLVASIVRKSSAQMRARRAAVSEDLGVMEALDRYFENNPDLTPFADDMKTYAKRLNNELDTGEQAALSEADK